ncbi:Bax inhibitor-1/YccA family protein [Paenibacillus polymyxa]|uniref:Bax inhibitor-1/YccA family protein n=1 Tax=Paenibacillus TaxID=44249 RepID=UPI000F4D851D|nr:MULTISPECIES: Bax inhibitor-1/YccA family protein [Paenibacillus]KAF6657084.1 Bax inhibitor-1/YccA family protein [Paenibacillus sp. EKM301P]RPD97213.1 Bax inhibitor-1/YccA family protein [Paenibacillus polymyxa]UBS87108.1 Bax inhibitor-1/YccA family protein [Paenibacillus polymyxa]WHX35684.1 Bax inhibitor-1/YccA family protein [Paenibacillus polymyxa]
MSFSNPVLRDDIFLREDEREASEQRMTIGGTVNKTLLLLVLLIVSSSITWYMTYQGTVEVLSLLTAGFIGMAGVALAISFFPKTAPLLSPVYAILSGFALGGVSAFMEYEYPGIVVNAILLTMGILFLMLFMYTQRIIKVTRGFISFVVLCTMAIFLVTLVDFILNFFGMNVPYIHETGWVGIGISLFIVIIAALNLLVDFNFIEEQADQGAPKYMEWYGAFALLVTLVWLYVRILDLLAKLSNRD